MAAKKEDIDFFYTEMRGRSATQRRNRAWKLQNKKRMNQDVFDKNFGKKSKIIGMLKDVVVQENLLKKGRRVFFGNDAQTKKGAIKLVIPECFSIIESPETAISVAATFARSVRDQRVRNIFVDHSRIKTYDLAASGLLDILAVELNTEVRRNKTKIRWRGRYPSDPHICRFIRSLGLVRHLEIKHEFPVPQEAAKLRLFDRRRKHYYHETNPKKADFKTKIVSEFADHINLCLKDHNKTLNVDAKHKLCRYTSEIIDNAEEHSGMNDWTIQGYLDNSLETPICEIAVFNFGKTIAETLQALPRDCYTWKQILPYLQAHHQEHSFGSDWTENDLLTLVALQGYVSSKNHDESDTRGNGTVDLIEFFQKVYEECAQESTVKAKMAIVSGGTYILFDGKFKMPDGEIEKKIIAFNVENDLLKKPDANYVHGLSGMYFPGTIISIRFPLSVGQTSNVFPTNGVLNEN